MRKPAVLCVILLSCIAVPTMAAPPALPAGWRLAEWWDLQGKDRQDVLADFRGSGNVDYATLAIREDAPSIGLLVWHADPPAAGKWTVLDQQKIAQAFSDVRLDAVADEDHPNRSNVLYCKASRECSLFAWNDESGKFQRSARSKTGKQKPVN